MQRQSIDDTPADSGGMSAKRSGPTAELRQAADELAGRVAEGEAVSADDLRRMRTLVALDLIRCSRPTARARGLELLEQVDTGQDRASRGGSLDEHPF